VLTLLLVSVLLLVLLLPERACSITLLPTNRARIERVTCLERFLSFFLSHSHIIFCAKTHTLFHVVQCEVNFFKKTEKFLCYRPLLQRSVDHHCSCHVIVSHMTSHWTFVTSDVHPQTFIGHLSNFFPTFVRRSLDIHQTFIRVHHIVVLLSCRTVILTSYRSVVLPSYHFVVLFDIRLTSICCRSFLSMHNIFQIAYYVRIL
jgi:hypothetical protein